MAVVRRCVLCLSVEAPATDRSEGVRLARIWTAALVCQVCARDCTAAHAKASSSDAGARPPWPGRILEERYKVPRIPPDPTPATIPSPPPTGRA